MSLVKTERRASATRAKRLAKPGSVCPSPVKGCGQIFQTASQAPRGGISKHGEFRVWRVGDGKLKTLPGEQFKFEGVRSDRVLIPGEFLSKKIRKNCHPLIPGTRKPNAIRELFIQVSANMAALALVPFTPVSSISIFTRAHTTPQTSVCKLTRAVCAPCYTSELPDMREGGGGITA